MALDRASKIALTIGGIIGIGGFIYWLISNKKQSVSGGRIMAISKLSSSDTFSIYPYSMATNKKDVAECSQAKIQTASMCPNFASELGNDKYIPHAPFKKGMTIKISGNSSINGTYVIEKVWSASSFKSGLSSLTLKNNGQWDGQMPKNTGLLRNCKTACYYFNKPMDIPTFKLK